MANAGWIMGVCNSVWKGGRHNDNRCCWNLFFHNGHWRIVGPLVSMHQRSRRCLGELANYSFPKDAVFIRGPYLVIVALLRHGHVDNLNSKQEKNLQMGEENDSCRAKTQELNKIRMKRAIKNLE